MLGRSRAAARRSRGGSSEGAGEGAAARKRDRGAASNAAGQGPLISSPGFLLGVVVIVRDEARYLPEWIAYHHALGVQHTFLYDNRSSDDLEAVLEPWIDHGLVTLVHWPLPGAQLDAYGHALRLFGPSVEWLAFIDVDEFIVPLVDEDIPTLLARWPDAADIRVPRVDFGFSGHRTPPGALTIDAYTHVANVFGRDPSKPPRVKTIARSRSVFGVGIHTATLPDLFETADGRPVPSRTIGARACQGLVQLNHYYTRSFEEFEAKRTRGSATGRIDRPAVPFVLPTLRVDTSAQRFAERTRETMARIGSLARSPYHYGSHLALPVFPRYNDLGLFAGFAVANVVAEEPAPRREPRIRLDNRHTGSGFVGRLPEGEADGADHRPRLGDLSLSPHLAPLLERTRGRLEAGWATSPGSVAATLTAGRVVEAPDGWRLVDEGGGVGADFELPSGPERRCVAVGIILRTDAPANLRLELEEMPQAAQGGPEPPTDVNLEAAGTYAAVVELDAAPRFVRRARVRIDAGPADILVHDLFVISYG
jgi:hypothetical protein